MEIEDEVQTSQQAVEKWEVVAIARAVERNRSFVLWYGDVANELRNLVGDGLQEAEVKLYEDVMEGRIKNVYGFLGPCRGRTCDVVVVAPGPLSERQRDVIEDLAKLYTFKGYDGNDEYGEVARTIHNTIKMWASGCFRMSGPAEAVYALAASYGLEIKEEAHLNRWQVGRVYYRIEGINTRIVKRVFYCNGCIDGMIGNNYIDNCVTWHFENE